MWNYDIVPFDQCSVCHEMPWPRRRDPVNLCANGVYGQCTYSRMFPRLHGKCSNLFGMSGRDWTSFRQLLTAVTWVVGRWEWEGGGTGRGSEQWKIICLETSEKLLVNRAWETHTTTRITFSILFVVVGLCLLLRATHSYVWNHLQILWFRNCCVNFTTCTISIQCDSFTSF